MSTFDNPNALWPEPASLSAAGEDRHDTVLLAGRRITAGFGRVALLLGLLTASFDIFLVANISGFTLRVHQVLLLVSLCSALQITYKAEKLQAPVGAAWLMLWVLCIFAFVPNTVYLPRSMGYALWLLFDVLIVFLTVQLFGSRRWMELLLRSYLQAFLCVAAFGLLQFLLGLARLPAPFVTQWIVPGALPRINGFSYEPSYFATYMLMGWVLSAWLLERRAIGLGKKLIIAVFITSSCALVLATSRLGWAMMLLWGAGALIRRLARRGSLSLSPLLIVAGLLLSATSVFVVTRSTERLQTTLTVLAGGTGFYGTAAHSVLDRQNSFANTIEVFKDSLLVGYSLGGVATAIGVKLDGTVTGNADAKRNEGSAVFAEVLAASGVIGVIPFLAYLLAIIRKPLILSRGLDREAGIILSGLVWSLCMELVILQFNQNILRSYLWFHIGVLSAAYAAALNHSRAIERERRRGSV